MAWKINNENQKLVGKFEDAEKVNFNTWGKKVAGGANPKTAADAWDSDYEVLKSANVTVKGDKKKAVHKAKCCSVRLSQDNRVYFMQVDDLEMCLILKAGDHKEPSWLKEI